MKKTLSIFLILFFTLFISIVFTTCTDEKGSPGYNDYPEAVGKILFTKCATKGCHTDASKDAAGGLSLASWDKLFEGGTGSACVIPYRSDYSTLFYYINTFPDLGVTLTPTMPFNKESLSREEVTTIKKWIDDGAPSSTGFVKFSDNPHRKKFYVPNQSCDVVTVFDQETLLPMRYINVGASPGVENPHAVRVSPDGQYWYVIFLNSRYLEKYRTSDDGFVGRVDINDTHSPLGDISANWSSFVISADSRTAYCIDYSTTGHIAVVNLDLLTSTVGTAGGFSIPHGCALNNAGDVLYVTEQLGNQLYKFPIGSFGSFSIVSLDPSASPVINAHEILFSPDGSTYFLTCQGTSEVRAYQTGTDLLLKIFPVGAMPSEMSFSNSPATPYLFVTCTEDTTHFPAKRGSVAIINYMNLSLPATFIYTGHQPHGIEVDDEKKLVYVANENFSTDGPAPHHSSNCGGRNGNVSFIDLNTLHMVTQEINTLKQVEVSVFPYAVGVRH